MKVTLDVGPFRLAIEVGPTPPVVSVAAPAPAEAAVPLHQVPGAPSAHLPSPVPNFRGGRYL